MSSNTRISSLPMSYITLFY